MKPLSFNKIARVTSYTIFWGWNITFLVLVLFGVMPWLGLAVTTAVLAGEIPLDFLISLWLLILVPAISVWLAFKKFRGQPQLQIRWFYGVEAPIFLLCLLRLFIFRELTLASLFLVGSILLATFIYSRHLIQLVIFQHLNGKVVLAFNSLLLVIAVYAGVLLSFYALPVGWSFIKFIFQFEWLKIIFELITTPDLWLPVLLGILWWTPFALLLLFFSIALFIFLPIALTRYYSQAWREAWQQEAQQSSLKHTWGISASVIVAWLGIFILVVQQPQGKIFTQLSQPANTPTQKNQLLDDAEFIRKGLLNAYLYRYRYLSAQIEVNHIKQIYKDVFGLPTAVTEPLQAVYNTLLSPVLYQGMPDDDTKAAKYYADLFDTPIQKGEAAAITTALEATADRDQVEAGLLNINQQKVWLAEQQITTTPSGPVTQVELYEVYENNTPERQEIFYYFALPENAAVTGLWLGVSPDRKQRQAFTVSPRGAAQKVYRAQVRERVDPALLEQVGPRQYRLRAFPVPPRRLPPRINHFFSRSTRQSTEEQDRMYLWLTYSVLNENKIAILPELLEKRNVYWTNATKWLVNGTKNSYRDDWMPPLVATDVIASETLTTELAINDAVYTVSAQPLPAELMKPNDHQKLAVLVDTSYSMRWQREQIKPALKWAAQQQADVFIQPVHESRQKLAVSQPNVSDITFFGILSASDLWNQAASLQAQQSYNAVFVLTDSGSYELTPDKPKLITAKAPIWLVHLDKLAPAYEDKIMYQILSSHGGVATNINSAYQQYLLQQQVAASQRIRGAYLWNFAVAPAVMNEDSSSKDNLIDPIAAKLLINYLASQPAEQTLEALDTIHQLAKTYSVITPYSSMIVLVNDQQRQQLRQAEQEKDRFERTVDSGIERLSKPGNLMVSAVPEPETWILIMVSLLLLYGLAKRNQPRCFGN
jgi:putative PEP-CTERM system integral membrane protein